MAEVKPAILGVLLDWGNQIAVPASPRRFPCAPVIRISLARFDAKRAPEVEAKLLASRERLEPGIRALKGNLGFFAGIDHANGAMQNVSIWETVSDAAQLDNFAR